MEREWRERERERESRERERDIHWSNLILFFKNAAPR